MERRVTDLEFREQITGGDDMSDLCLINSVYDRFLS